MLKTGKKALIVLAALVLVYTLVGFFVLPPILTSVMTKNLSQTLHRRVSMQKIKVNPYTLTAEVRGLTIKDRMRPDTFVSLASISLDMEWSSLFKLAPIIREVKLDRPSIKIIRYEDGTYNFSDLMQGGKKGAGKSAKPLEFSVANIQISGGRVDFDDRPAHKAHAVRDMVIAIPFISNIPSYIEVFVQPRFQATINRTPVLLTGKTKPFSDSLETTLALNLKDIDLPNYLAYVPMKLGLKVDSGWLDINAELSYKHFRTKRQPILEISGELAGRNLDINDLEGNPILHLPQFSAILAPSRVLKKEIHISKAVLNAPVLHVNRDKKGRLNLLAAMKTTPSKPHARDEAPAKPLMLDIDAVALTDGGIAYSDLSGSSPVKLAAEGLSVTAQSISTANQGGGKVDLVCTLNGSAHLALDSSFTLHPIAADIKVHLDGFQPAWVQPYVMDRLPILIRRGKVASQGEIKLALASPAPPQVHFTGDIQCADFACVDRVYTEDLAAWKNLTITGLDYSLNPTRIIIHEIGLTAPVSTFIILPGGQSILAALTAPPKNRPTPSGVRHKAKQKGPSARIAVGRILCKNGRFNFKDRSISPQYATSLNNVSGSITGLSSEEFKKADVNLKAKLDNQSPLTITGAVNPLKKDLFVDLVAHLKNIELSPATPYSGKYLGYALDKGKLSLDLSYHIDKKQLQAQNDVLIDQLTFGPTVKSKDATKLPVKLAVALLRDNSGKIDLHLPVTGRTDDPDFHVGRVIIHMLVNILKKAATAPFSLLEAIYPGASVLNSITFEPGRATIPAAEKPKLDKLALILGERASLNLEISGFMDAQSDREGLRDYLFERHLKQQKLNDLLRKGRQAPAVDDILLAPDEFHAYLEKAYRAMDFAKEKNAIGMLKTLPDDQMHSLMLEHIQVSDDDLLALAAARAKEVRDYLEDSGKIDAGRMFLVKGDDSAPPQSETPGNARVILNIR